MKSAIFLWLTLLLSAPAAALDSAAGTGGASFLKAGFGSTRAMGMGRAYVAIAEGSDALAWNPAGLALAQTREATYSYVRYIQGIDAPLFFGYAHPLGQTVLGLNVSYMNVDGFDARDISGRPVDNSNVQVHDGFTTLGIARSFLYEKLFLGLGLKTVYEDNAGARRTSLVGDLGILMRPNPTFSYGFSFQNLGTSDSRVGKINRIGGAARPLDWATVSLELQKPSDNNWLVGLGTEVTLPEELLSVGQVNFRVGYYGLGNQGQVLAKDRSTLYPLIGAQGLSFGLGLFSSQAFGYGLGFDYALVPMGALGTADYLSLRMRF